MLADREDRAGCILPPVQTCPECGNHGLTVRLVDRAAVHECSLCGARFGDRAAIAMLSDREQAAARGVDAEVWPLVRALTALPGLVVRRSGGTSGSPPTLPFVELAIGDAQALVQVENLAKSLRLAAGGLHLHWQLVVEFQQNLVFVLKPRHPGGPVTTAEAADARLDLGVLATQLARDVRLSWWRHAGPEGPR